MRNPTVVTFEKPTLDGMVKATVQCGGKSRSVWFGVGRRYRVEAITGNTSGKGRVGYLESLDLNTFVMRIRWDDSGRLGAGKAQFLVEAPERTGQLHAAAPRSGQRLSRARSQDRGAGSVERLVARSDSMRHRDAETIVSGFEKRADRRPLCELCQDIHVRARRLRVCESCWTKLGRPSLDWVDDHLNDLAYQSHVQARAHAKRSNQTKATPW